MKSEKFKIMIIDDERFNIDILIDALKDNYETIIAKSGEQAFKRLEKIIPDLILLDIIMPEMDGYEVLKRMKGDERIKHIPVIFITAMNEVGDETKGLEIGAIDYITKPISTPIVQARVKNHLTLKQYRDHLEELVADRTIKLEKAMDELKVAKEKAESANKAKSNFLMTMSHELRTPLNGILSASELISTCDSKEELEDMQEIIMSSGNYLLETVENILDFTKFKDGTLELIENSFRLNEILNDIKTRFLHKGKYLQLNFTIEMGKSIPYELIGDNNRLLAVLNHLTENAAKFALNNPIATLFIKMREKSEEQIILQFSLKDNGIGVAAENFEKIFEPFWQVDNSTTRQYDGVGIGLSVCKQWVNLMGGDIWIESEINKGSTFHFTVRFKLQKI